METADEATLAGDEPTGPRRDPFDPRPGKRHGDRLGRYTVLDLLGKGGMGLVYAAYDPQLDRRVAVKVLRTTDAGPASELARQRLLREAQAMAKLSHPNVVAVHDVGTLDDEVFVAMELVEGPTLAQWLEPKTRTVPQIVDVFAQAGRGLAAAHAMGMIHRDFKPANVLIDRDGRAKVTDFGLVRTDPSLDTSSPDSSRAPPPRSLLLTDAGALQGTPAYMAPEQHARGALDARTDQFGFCVSLYEALYGLRPFADDSMAALVSAVSRGELRDPPARADVPATIRDAVLRGLAHDPSDRWPDMHALLEALLDDPGRRRRRWLLAGAGLLALGGLVALAARPVAPPLEPPPPCAEADAGASAVWSPARREAIRSAFAATPAPHAPALWARIDPVVDQYVARWRASARDACEATRVRGEQSDSLFDRRRACLDRRLHELDARLTVLADVDESVLDHGFSLVSSLAPIETCEDANRLLQTVPPPDDPEQAAQVIAVRQRHDELMANMVAGRYEGLSAEADALLARAESIEYAALRGEVRMLASSVREHEGRYEESERLLQLVAIDAAEGHDDLLLARAWVSMPYLVGYLQSRPHDADLYEPVARAALMRVGQPNALVQSLEQGLGAVRLQQGDHAAARTHYLAALAHTGPGDHDALARAKIFNNLAVLQMSAGQYHEARRSLEQVLSLREGLLPPDHPEGADIHQNLAMIAGALAEYDRALEHVEIGLSLVHAAVPEGSPREVMLLGIRSQLLHEQGRFHDSRRDVDAAMAMSDRIFGAEHPANLGAWTSLARIARDTGRFEEARAALATTKRLAAQTFGESDPRVALFVHELGTIELAEGHTAAGAGHMDEAIAALTESNPEDPQLGPLLRWRGDAARKLGDDAGAVLFYERALALLDKPDSDQRELARVRAGLARSLPASERPRARELAELARRRLVADGRDDEVTALDRWRAAHE